MDIDTEDKVHHNSRMLFVVPFLCCCCYCRCRSNFRSRSPIRATLVQTSKPFSAHKIMNAYLSSVSQSFFSLVFCFVQCSCLLSTASVLCHIICSRDTRTLHTGTCHQMPSIKYSVVMPSVLQCTGDKATNDSSRDHDDGKE